MLEEGLIVPAGDVEPRDWAPAAAADDAYGLPELERFTDMADLILLDPIHDVDDMGWPHAVEQPGA